MLVIVEVSIILNKSLNSTKIVEKSFTNDAI